MESWGRCVNSDIGYVNDRQFPLSLSLRLLLTGEGSGQKKTPNNVAEAQNLHF